MNELLRKMMGRVLMKSADDGAGGGAGAGGGGAAAAGGNTDDKVGAGAAGGGDNRSLLDDEAGGGDGGAGGDGKGTEDDATLTPEQRQAKAAEKDTRRPKHIPGKFWNAEKGEPNLEAWSKSYGDLEGRIRDVGLPPKSADEYKFDAPAALKESGVEIDPDRNKAFRDEAFKAGLTQKQFEFVMGKYYGSVEELVSHGERVDRANTMKALTEHFKTPEAVQENVKAAYAVFQAYADEEEMKHLFRVVNDPIAVRVLAKINKELQEDRGLGADSVLSAESVDELMAAGGPYWDASHPQHARVKAKVTQHFEAQAKAQQRRRAA